VVPPTILSLFFARSFAQQIIHNIEYTKWKNNVTRLLEDKDLKKSIIEILQNVQNQTNNRNAIKMEDLNWNKNPAIKEAAEQLGIFEKEPSSAGPINLDTADPALKKMAEEFDLIKKSKLKPKKLIKAKSTSLRELLGEVLDSDSESDLDIIDVEVVEDRLRIRIDEEL